MINISDYKNIKFNSLQDAEKFCNVLVEKIEEIEDREPTRDTGIIEEIIHLRGEITPRLDQLTLESKALTAVVEQRLGKLEKQSENQTAALGKLEKQSENQTAALGKLEKQSENQINVMEKVLDKLDEISKKLD